MYYLSSKSVLPLACFHGSTLAPQRSVNAAQSAIIDCGAQYIFINVILYLEICAGRPIVRASRVKICDLREERFLADDDTVELPDTDRHFPCAFGMGQKVGSPIKCGGMTEPSHRRKYPYRSLWFAKKRFEVDHLLRGELSLGRVSDLLQLNSGLGVIVHLIGCFSNSGWSQAAFCRLPVMPFI